MADFDFSDIDAAIGATRTPSQTTPTSGYDYASSSFNPQTVKKNPYFLDDLRRYYESKGITDRSDDELYDLLLDDSNVRLTNTFAPFAVARGSYADVANDADEDKQRFARLKQVVDQTPFFFQEGGRSLGEVLPSVAKGVATDPLNYLTGGVAGAIGAARGVAATARGVSAGRAIAEGAGAAAKGGALFEGGVGAVSGGISSAGEQSTNVELGLQDEVSSAGVFEDALVSGALSGTIGAFIGGIGGAIGAGRGRQVAEGLKSLGYTDDEVLSMGMKDGVEALRQQIPPPARDPEVEPAAEPTDPTKQVEELAKKQKDADQQAELLRLNSTREALRAYNKELIGEQQDLIADGADERRINVVQQQLSQVSRLLEFHGRMATERKQIDDLLASNEPAKLKEGERRRNLYERDLAGMKALVERPVPEDMARYIDERIAREDDIAAQAALDKDAAKAAKKAALPSAAAEAAPPPAGGPEASPTSAGQEPVTPAPASDDLGDLIPDDTAPAQVAEQVPTEPTAPAVKARTAIRDFAIQQGVDINEVAPTGANGVVTKSDIKKHLAAKGNSASIVETEDLIADGIDILQRRFGNSPEVLDSFRQNPAALTRFILETKGITDEAKGRAIRDLLDTHSRSEDIPTEASPIDFTASEKKRMRRIVADLKKNNPDTPDMLARDMAERTVVRGRAASGDIVKTNSPKQRQGFRSAGAATERAAQLPTAGRSNTGKIQSFLRPAATFNAGADNEYSIAGRFTNTSGRRASTVGDIPSPSTLSFEEAYIRASSQKGTEHPVAFVSDGVLGLADSPTPAQKGETLWVDGRSGKAFRDWRNIYEKYYGHVPSETPPQIASQLASPRHPDTPDAKLKTTGDLVAALGRGEISARDFEKRVAQLTRPRTTPVDMPPLQRNDGMVAMFVRKTPGSDGTTSSRKASPQDIADGLTAQDIIGRNSNLDDWHLVYVPSDTPDTRNGRALAARKAKPEPAAKKQAQRGALDYDSYERTTFYNQDLTPEDWRALEAAASLQKKPDAAIAHIQNLQQTNAGVTGRVLNRLINNIEGGQLRDFNKTSIHTANWPSKETGRAGMVRLLTQLYDLQSRMAPDGFALPTADRQAAVADIERIFKKSGPEQLRMARDFINDLNSNARPAFLSAGDGVASTEAISRSGDRLGSITVGKDFKSKREIPQIATLYHEAAHWAYMNILTPTERLSFWDAMGKYYDANGTFSPKEVARRSPLAKVNGQVYGPTNALNSPSEFFANQFAMRMMQRAPFDDPQGVWSRITRFIKAIFDRFLDKSSIDPDLEPFFARILPDAERKAAEVRAFTQPAVIDDLADLIPDDDPIPARQVEEVAPRPARTGPSEDFTSLGFDGMMERADPSRESLVRSLYWNAGQLDDLENLWKQASDLDDPTIAVEAAQQTVRYLRGSAFTRDQATKMARAAARATGTPLQDIRTKAIYGPYQKAGKLSANMRNKVYDLSAIMRGKEVVGLEDAADEAALDKRLSSVSEAFGGEGFSVSGNMDEVGSRLIQLYRYGKKHPDGSFRKGSSLADVFNLARKALNTDFERTATRPRKDAVNTRIAAAGYSQVSIGKFADTRVGDTFVRTSDKGRTEVFTLTQFTERKDGMRIGELRMPDGNYDELTPESAKDWRRAGTRGPNVLKVADDLSATIKRNIAETNNERTNLVEQKKSAAKGRTTASTLAPARPDQPSPRAMSEEALESVIVSEADNVSSERAADELLSKQNSHISIPTKSVPRSIPDDTAEIAEYADEAFRMGDEDADQWARALYLANGSDDTPIIQFSDSRTATAIEVEKQQTRTSSRDVGVPGGVQSDTRELLMGINHRKHRHTYNARTLAYRVLNLAQSEGRQVTRGDVASWLNVKLEDGKYDDLFGSTSDPLYKQFRDTFRRIGSFMEDAAADEGFTLEHAVNSLVSVLFRVDGDIDAALGVLPQEIVRKLNDQMDETLSTAVVSKWVQDAVRHRLLNGSGNSRVAPPKVDKHATAEEIAKANALVSRVLDQLGYATNGLISSGPVRDVLYRLTWYGDPFADRTPARVLATPAAKPSAPANPINGLSVSRARFVLDDIATAPQARKDAISAFVGKNIDDTADAVQFYHIPANQAQSSFGQGKGRYGDGIYLESTPTDGSDSSAAVSFMEATKDPSTREEIKQALDELRDLSNSINSLAGATSKKGQARLAKYLQREDALIDHLAALDVDGINRVVPVVVRAKAPVDVSASIDSPEKLKLLHELLAQHAGNSSVTLAELERATNAFARTIETNGVGSAPMSRYLQAIAKEAGDANPDMNSVNRLLRAAGFDSIKTPSGTVIFDSSNIRVATDRSFDVPDVPMKGGQSLAIAGAMLSRMIESADDAIPVEKMPLVLGPISRAEPLTGVTNFVGNMLKNRRPTVDDSAAIIRFGSENRLANAYKFAKGILRSNADSLRSLRMNWIADWFDTTFQDTTQTMARMLYGTTAKNGPLRALEALPDSSGLIQNHLRYWFRSVSMDALGTRKWGADQPESHKKILSALRSKNRRSWSSLTGQERAAAETIRAQFRDTLNQLKAHGVEVGDLGEDYFPQVWDARAIQKDKEGFINAMAAYLRAEAKQSGRAVDEVAISNTASRMYTRMSDSEAEGLFMETLGQSRKSSAENLDYSRLLKLDSVPEGSALKGFLESDLSGILVKYYDAAARRLKQVEKFGNKSHGAYDYLQVVREGKQGIAYLLSHNRVERSVATAIGRDGVEDVVFASNFNMPFEGNEFGAQKAAGELMEIHDQLGPVLAREYLMQKAPIDQVTGLPSIPYQRRVDAIVAALDDFGGIAQDMTQDTYRFFENVLTLSNRKPLASSQVARGASRFIRNFNSISLLGFTLLSSLGDTILPLVRSGSMRTTLKALRSMAADPDYRRIINNVGASMESVLHDRLSNLYGGSDGKLSNAFFSGIGLTPWTDVMRSFAASVGYETFSALQAKALKAYKPGAPVNAQGRQFKQAYRLLKQYGLESYATNTTQSLADRSLIESDDLLRTAMIRFADDSVFAPNANEVPVWAHTPLGQVLFQFKSFPLMMMRLTKEVLYNDTRLAIYDALGKAPPAHIKGSGNLNRAKYLLTLTPLMGAGVLYTKDVIQGRGEDEHGNYVHAARQPLASKFLNLNGPLDDSTVDALAGWYLEGMAMAGGYGLLLDTLHNVLGQADNGAYGVTRVASTIFGPSVGTGISAFNVVGGIDDALMGRTPTNSKERLAVRELATRIPVVGGMPTVREDIVNSVAGEQQRRQTQRAAKAATQSMPDYSKLF